MGYGNSGFTVDESRFEYVQFKTNIYTQFIERHLLTLFVCAPLCRYAGTETLHLNDFDAAKAIVSSFSDNYGGSGFQTFPHHPKPKRTGAKTLTDAQKLERRIKMKENAEKNRQSQNHDNLEAFAKWFDQYENRITVRPYANFGVRENYFVLDIDLTALPRNLRYDPIWCSLPIYSKPKDYLRFSYEMTAYCVEGDRGQLYFNKPPFYELKLIDRACWLLLPERIREIFGLFDFEVRELYELLEPLPEEYWTKYERANEAELEREHHAFISEYMRTVDTESRAN